MLFRSGLRALLRTQAWAPRDASAGAVGVMELARRMSTGADPVLGRTEGRYGLQVSNIPADIQAADVAAVFRVFGPVNHVHLLGAAGEGEVEGGRVWRDKGGKRSAMAADDNRPSLTARVEMATRASADCAILELNRRRLFTGGPGPLLVSYSKGTRDWLSTLVARELGLADALQSKEGTTPRVAIRNVPESWGEDRLRDALASLGVGEPVGVEVKGRSGTIVIEMPSPDAAIALKNAAWECVVDEEGGQLVRSPTGSGRRLRVTMYDPETAMARRLVVGEVNPENRCLWMRFAVDPSRPFRADMVGEFAARHGEVQHLSTFERDGAVTSEVLFRRISAIEAAITSLDNPEHNRDALCAMDGRVAAMPVSRRTRRAVQRLPPPGVPPSHVALRVFGGLPEEGREAAGVVREALRQLGSFTAVTVRRARTGPTVTAWGTAQDVQAALNELNGRTLADGLGPVTVRRNMVVGMWDYVPTTGELKRVEVRGRGGEHREGGDDEGGRA